MALDNKVARLQKSVRTKLKDKGILYSDYLGIYGNVLGKDDAGIEQYKSLPEYLRECAEESGFLFERYNTSLYGNTEVWNIQIDDEHPYREALIHEMGMTVSYITLYIGEMSAKLMFVNKYNGSGVVFNMIDGICDFMNILCVIDSHGWNIEDDHCDGDLLEMYRKSYYDALAEKLKQ